MISYNTFLEKSKIDSKSDYWHNRTCNKIVVLLEERPVLQETFTLSNQRDIHVKYGRPDFSK